MSSKVYSIKYTGAALPKARAPITITAGNLRSVPVAFLTEGYITRLVIKQTGGTPVAAVVEVLDSKIPFPVGQYAVATAAADDIELYRIIAQQAVTSGAALTLIHEEYGFPFHNQDGTFSDNQRYIYIVIKPTSSLDTTTWEMAITGHNEIG
jgi:hypothetical protein